MGVIFGFSVFQDVKTICNKQISSEKYVPKRWKEHTELIVKPLAVAMFKEVTIKNSLHVARVVSLDGIEGMFLTHLAELFDITSSGMSKHIRKYKLPILIVDGRFVRDEFGEYFISPHAGKISFVPKESIRSIIKVVRSESAWEIYNQLFSKATSTF